MTNPVMKCLKPEAYRVTDEWAAAGFESPEEVRHEMVWRLVRGELDRDDVTLRAHLSECSECRKLAESFERLDGALANKNATTFAVCPSPQTLGDYLDDRLTSEQRLKVRTHLDACEACRQDLDWFRQSAEPKVVEISRRRWMAWAGAAAASVVAGSFAWWKTRPSSPYAHLAEIPDIDHENLFRTVGKDESVQALFQASVDAYARQDYAAAYAKANEIVRANARNSSALFMMGMAEYRQGRLKEADRLIEISESIRPKTDYRCWTALQFALLTGNVTRILKECQHVDGHERYQARARRILAEVRRIQKV